MLNVKGPERMTPPGVALVTETFAQPSVVSSDLSTIAVSWVSLTSEVGRAVAFQFTTEPLSKSCPFTVRVRVSEPACAKDGDSEATLGDWTVFGSGDDRGCHCLVVRGIRVVAYRINGGLLTKFPAEIGVRLT